MPSKKTSLDQPTMLMIVAAMMLVGLLGLIGSLMGGGGSQPSRSGISLQATDTAIAQQGAPLVKTGQWAASAPGRVEPKGGEIRLSAQSAGRVIEIPAKVNDVMQAGDLLLRTDDEDPRAKLAGADAEAAVRRRERDAEAGSGRLAIDRRQAEDALASAERAVLIARTDLDRAMRNWRAGTATVADVDRERATLKTAIDKVETDRTALRRAQTASGVPLPTRVEAGLTASRAEVSLVELALERTRLRAPAGGTVLQINTRLGETVATSPEHVLIVIGDVSALRVRAEVEERDVSKVRVGQFVVLRSDAFPGREFTGTVASRAQALGPAKLAQKGPRRPTDVDTLEVMIDVDAGTPLLPGMRTDVFFRADAAAAVTTEPVKK